MLASGRWGLTPRSTGPIAAGRHLGYKSLAQMPSRRNGPVSSNVRRRTHPLARLSDSTKTPPTGRPVACLSNPEEKRSAMAIPIDVLEAEALSLPQADRSRLVDRLLASLGHAPEWEEAWSQEADRREARIVAGQAQWVNGPDAVARIRDALK